MLKVDNLHVAYDGIQALRGVRLEVPRGSLVALIGANGAGKSTLLRAIAGLLQPRAGRIEFEGRAIQGRPAHRIAREGLVLVPEGRRMFPNLTVEENLKMGGFARSEADVRRAEVEVLELFPRLRERRRQLGGTLSGGEQQMLALGRALMARPRLLMIDEPSLGLAPKIVLQVFDALRRIHAGGLTLLLIEQNARLALQNSDHAYVLETGEIALEGPSRSLIEDPRVREAYLGA
ncbi:MAG: ABC transporter ATP-binding protein [Nitrospirae bacterium]|nr:ABC transporter ATP-binding protein [Nitrospirota bacterium]